MPSRRSLFVLVLACVLWAPAALAANPHPFSVHDLVAFQRISDPQASPDGSRVVFQLRTTDLEANRGRYDLWMVDIDGSGLRQLTFTPESESNPRWAPDGQAVYFLSGRNDSAQIWRLPMTGGEAVPVTALPLDVGGFVLSPDGQKILFSVEVFPDCASKPEGAIACTKTRLDEQAKRKATGRLYTQLFVRHWDEWKDGRRAHLFVMPAGGGQPADLMKTMDADSPSKPFGGTEEYTFTPDGKSVVFTARDVGPEEAWSTNHDLFLVPADGSAKPRNLTEGSKGWDTGPVFSPDGKTLAYRSMFRAGYEADRFRVMLRTWPDGPEEEASRHWDRSPSEIVWSPDGKFLYATADDLGNHSLFALSLATNFYVRVVVKDGNIGSPSVVGDRILFSRDSFRSPADLFTVPLKGGEPTRITEINRDQLAAVKMGETEQFIFKGALDESVFGWLVKPVDFDPAKKYPVAFLIHGGPQGSWANDFHYRWNPQVYAGAGYAVVMIDFHGSTGYGRKFTDSIRGDWGGKPLEDLQKGLAEAIEKYPFLDGERVAALGASYGGYMINWIAGAWPDRFRCLVSHDGNLDERFAYFDTEELWFPEWDHSGTPWDNPEGYSKHNPVDLVKNWKTPILVVHGGKDYRVVDTQGIATFTAAQRRGIPSQFLHFPDENHWVLKPANSILWHETVLAWLDRWTRK